MRLADRISQSRTPFIVENMKNGSVTRLNNAATFSQDIENCATRFVLSDELTRLCTALAYSKGASTLAFTDLLYVPAERVWVEWTESPWESELSRYGFTKPVDSVCSGRRGVFIQSNREGRSGVMRTFRAARPTWTYFLAAWRLTSILTRKPATNRPPSTGRNARHFVYRTMLREKQTSCGAAFDSGLSARGKNITMRLS